MPSDSKKCFGFVVDDLQTKMFYNRFIIQRVYLLKTPNFENNWGQQLTC